MAVSSPLAIVGASARSAAASAARAGFRPLAADLFADADLRQIATATRVSSYPDGLLDWLRAIEPPAWMYTGALENHPELIDQMAWIAPLWGNPGDVLARVRSPWELARALGAAGHLFPETRSSPDGLPHDGSWLAKTYRGASGSGVRAWSKEQGAGSEEQGSLTPRSMLAAPCFVQQRIAGIPVSAVFVAADRDATLLGVTRQLVGEDWLGAHGFQYAGSIGPAMIPDAAHAEIAEIGRVLVAEFELLGLFGVDMILVGEQVWTLEVNPRYTASVEVLERGTGVAAIALHAAACGWLGSSAGRLEPRERWLGSSDSEPPELESAGGSAGPRPQPPMHAVHGKAVLFARRDVVISETFATATLAEALRMPWPSLADISAAGTPIEAGRPVLTMFADGATDDEVERQLRRRASELERALYAGSGVFNERHD